MTAFQIIMLLSVGAPLTPAGGSSCNLEITIDASITVQHNNTELNEGRGI